MFVNEKYYVAYAYHHWASLKDITENNKPYDTYEEACIAARDMLCDDDDVKIYLRRSDKWFQLAWIVAEDYPDVPRVPKEADARFYYRKP